MSLLHTSSQQHRGKKKKPCYTNQNSFFTFLPFILIITLYLYFLYTHEAVPDTRVHGPNLPTSLISVKQPDTDGNSSHAVRRESLCVSPCADLLLLMSLLGKRMTPAVLCVLDTKNNHSALTLQSCLLHISRYLVSPWRQFSMIYVQLQSSKCEYIISYCPLTE